MTSTDVPDFLNEIGREPYFRLVARLLASLWLKLPVIWALCVMRSSFVAAEMTCPSRVMAISWPVPAIALVASPNRLLP